MYRISEETLIKRCESFTVIRRQDRPKVIALRKRKMTYKAIGDVFGVTRERIRQILKLESPELTGGLVPEIKCSCCGSLVTGVDKYLAKKEGHDLCKNCRAFKKKIARLEGHIKKYAERYKAVLNMRSIGKTWYEIAEALDPRFTEENKASCYIFFHRFKKTYEQKLKALSKIKQTISFREAA